MSSPGEPSFKRFFLWCLIGAFFLLAGYLALVFVLSILIGLKAAPQPGFWVPILAGTAFLIPLLFAIISITKLLIGHMAEEDIVNL